MPCIGYMFFFIIIYLICNLFIYLNSTFMTGFTSSILHSIHFVSFVSVVYYCI